MISSLLDFKYPVDCCGIEGIGTQPVQTTGWKYDNTTLFDGGDGTLNYFGLGVFTVYFINFQSFSLFAPLGGPFPV